MSQGSRLPEQLSRRAAAVAKNTDGAPDAAPMPPGATTEAPGGLSRTYATLRDPAPGGGLQLLWLREAAAGAAPAAFARMRAELSQLNALYARALQQAAMLMSARTVGAVSNGAVASLQAVEASSVGATMAAMDALNDLEPLQALSRTPGQLCAPSCTCAACCALHVGHQTAAFDNNFVRTSLECLMCPPACAWTVATRPVGAVNITLPGSVTTGAMATRIPGP